MKSEKKMRIALIVSVSIFILGAVFLTIGQLISIFTPLSYVLMIFGVVASMFTFFSWRDEL